MDKLRLPAGVRPLVTQVAGHIFQENTDAIGLLQDLSSGCVLKPLGKPACGQRELGFYEAVETTRDPVLADVRALVPHFYESIVLCVNQRESRFLKLQDLTHNMGRPCIMDIKIGRRTWDPLATPEKRSVEEEKYAKCKNTLGLCLPGFQFYRSETELLRYDKVYGKQLDPKDFRQTMANFLNAETHRCEALLREILLQLFAIHNWFEEQRIFHFYASSILVAYDYDALLTYREVTRQGNRSQQVNGLGGPGEEAEGYSSHDHYAAHSPPPRPNPKHWVKVKMIDFAHVFPAEDETRDANYIFGLDSLIRVIEELLEDPR